MLVFRICLFWLLVSTHVVGGAALFHRRFPRESPWFGFFVPSLILILALNMVEHAVALPTLIWLLPFTLSISLWSLFAPGLAWRKIWLPTAIFLTSFAFTLTLRALKPSILTASSGPYDLTVLASFCMGSTVPPPCSVFPPHTIGHYYTFLHYGASVLIRLLDVDIGTGFNLSSALVSAWTCLLTAAIAWTLSRHRIGITLLSAFLVECAANGSSAYLFVTNPDSDPLVSSDLFLGLENSDAHTWVFQFLKPTYIYSRRELMVPGFWSWLGTFHATNGGILLTLLIVQAMAETLRRHPTNWPWICLVASPLLMLITSTWGMPIVVPLTLATLACCSYYGLRPRSLRFVLLSLGVLLLMIAPTYFDLLPLSIFPTHGATQGDLHTQPVEFFLYWWPIYIPWLALLFVWRRLDVTVRIILVCLPIFYLFVEIYNIGARTDMTGKLWGFIWAAGWSVIFPTLARHRATGFRLLTLILLASCFLSLGGWLRWYSLSAPRVVDSLQIDGTGTLRTNPLTSKILDVAETMKGKTFLTGSPSWCCTDSAAIACFTGNYSYINASFYCDSMFCPGTQAEPERRDDEVNAFYAGKIQDPLDFLHEKNIAAVFIYPDDKIPDEVVAQLKQKLSPEYEYRDFNEGRQPNSGIFVSRSLTLVSPK